MVIEAMMARILKMVKDEEKLSERQQRIYDAYIGVVNGK